MVGCSGGGYAGCSTRAYTAKPAGTTDFTSPEPNGASRWRIQPAHETSVLHSTSDICSGPFLRDLLRLVTGARRPHVATGRPLMIAEPTGYVDHSSRRPRSI